MFSIQHELGTTTFTDHDEDGYLIAQPDGLGENPELGSYPLEHTFGFISRPRDPDTDRDGKPLAGKACNALIGKTGDQTHVWLASDPRFIPNIPQLKKGGAAMYSAPGSFRVLDGEDGTETFYYPVPGADKAHIITTGLDGNQRPFIGIEHCDGLAITMLEGSLVLKNKSGSAYIELNDNGIIVNGNTVINGGLTSGNPTSPDPAVKFLELQAYLQMLEANIETAFGLVLAGMAANGAAGAASMASTAAARAALLNTAAATNTHVF